MKKPKPVKLKYGPYKGNTIKAHITRDDGVSLPALEASHTYAALDEYVWSNPENARAIASFLLEWAAWAEEYLEGNPKRKQWLLRELSEGER